VTSGFFRPERREVLGQQAGDLPRRVDRVLCLEGLSGLPSRSVEATSIVGLIATVTQLGDSGNPGVGQGGRVDLHQNR
jgi:hypothetical protein